MIGCWKKKLRDTRTVMHSMIFPLDAEMRGRIVKKKKVRQKGKKGEREKKKERGKEKKYRIVIRSIIMAAFDEHKRTIKMKVLTDKKQI